MRPEEHRGKRLELTLAVIFRKRISLKVDVVTSVAVTECRPCVLINE